MKKLFLFSTIIAVLCLGIPSAATTYYVATTGNDSAACTQAAPCATVNHVDTLVVPGDVVRVLPGTYAQAPKTVTSGTSALPITYISDTPWTAKFTGTSSNYWLWELDGSHTRLEYFELDGSGQSGVREGVQIDGTTPVANTTDAWVLGNKIHDTSSACNQTGNAVIIINGNLNTGGANLIYGNLLYHNNCGHTGSTESNNGQHGIYSQLAGDVISNNVVIDQGGGWCIQAWHKVTNWTVTNNTLIFCQHGGITVDDDATTGVTHSNDTITNNVVVNSGVSGSSFGAIYTQAAKCTSNDVISNNLMYGNQPSDYVGTTCGGADFSASQTGSNATTFVNYTASVAGDYHLKAGSTGIGTGTNNCASGMSPCLLPTDKDGVTRGSPPSIGAYEGGDPFTLTVALNGAGTVTSSPAGINCGAACSELAPSTLAITLTASPASGQTFVGWSGSALCSGTAPCTLSIPSNTTVTANFSTPGTVCITVRLPNGKCKKPRSPISYSTALAP